MLLYINILKLSNQIKNTEKVTYFENSEGYWIKREFDSKNNKIYYEDSFNSRR
jgi:hypothetical protein